MRSSDKKRRKTFQYYETKKKSLKSISFNENLDSGLRWWANVELSKMPRKSSLCRTHNFCVETGRSRSVISYYQLSRLRLRKRASRGSIQLKKSSW